jgi:type IV secretion system protein VirB11
MSAQIKLREVAGDVYLGAYLAPFLPWLQRADVTELLVNRPGELWVEDGSGLNCIAMPEVGDRLLQRLAEQVARISRQGINNERPLLGATLPDGSRVQFIGPSATRGHWAMAIRRHRLLDLRLDAYASLPKIVQPDEAGKGDDPIACLRRAISGRQTILISGGTSTGKTTFLNALLREMPQSERLILVEDTPEIHLHGPNGLGLVAVKGALGEAHVTTDDLLAAALRLRPDRIVLGELRGNEAVSFLRAINTGHPGSLSTIHANSPAGALEQLALMVMQSGIGLSRADTIAYAKSVIDIVVQLDRRDGHRGIAAIVPTTHL